MPRVDLPEFPIEGGCVCGAVRYRLSGPPLAAYNCHCTDCQRASGGNYTVSLPTPAERAEVISGELEAFDKPADSGRTVRMQRCAKCGTNVINVPLAAPSTVIVKAGTLDDPSWLRPIGNIWTDSRHPAVLIDETLVNFPGQPPDRQALYDAWEAALA
ncbi:GFA family protein [Devosia sp.]|uniref:GFA family protein n=1 Tax=Devosia sp. TaxID=1871048 RepID=UPI003A946171